MGSSFLAENELRPFVEGIRRSTRVVAPVAKRQKFVFAELESVDDLRLDYDVTILPPKKLFFPPKQQILVFDGETVSDCIDPVDTVLFGVHTYDVKGIDMTDFLLAERFEDWNYLAQRRATTIVAMTPQVVAPRAFWGSVGVGVEAVGHDALLTKIDGGYLFETLTPKGEALLAFGAFREATAGEIDAARQAAFDIAEKCAELLPYSSTDIASRVRESFGNEELWDDLAMDCFSCGSCNLVCPTCYCFDVRDSWNVDQASGSRTRYWDACLTREFAAVTMAGGQKENFRGHHASRFRHRFMRKAAYLHEKLGGPACTGCGRCSSACTANIADPVRVINIVMGANE